MTGTLAPAVGAPTPAQARRGLRLFGTTLVLLSAGSIGAYAITDDAVFGGLALASPAAAGVLTRLVRHEGFADVSFRFGGRRSWAAVGLALLVPLVVAGVSYGLAWGTGLAGFDPLSATSPLGGGELVVGDDPELSFVVQVLVASTVVAAVLGLVSLGEELGWRGYLLVRLVDAGVPRPVLVHSVLWALWHLPLTLLVGYAAGPSVAVSAVVLLVQITAAGYVIGRLRLSTGSIWPAVAFHGAWNGVVQAGYDPATTGEDAALWVGESGLFTTAAVVLAAWLCSRGAWAVRRRPADPPVPLPRP